MKEIRIIVLLMVALALGTPAQQSDEIGRREKAKDILEQSRAAIFKAVTRAKIKSLQIKSETKSSLESTITMIGNGEPPRETKARTESEEELAIEFDDKIKQVSIVYNSDKSPSENYTKIETGVNGAKFYQTSETIIDGKRFNMDDLLNNPVFSGDMKKTMKELAQTTKPTKERIVKGVFADLFPILLDPEKPGNKSFIYVGKAETGDKRADILEIETNTGRQTRYFFDEKTHHLLMTTDEVSKDGKSAKTTTFFDDYQLFDGVLVARKVNTETESSSENTEMEMFGVKMKFSNKSKMVSERIIKEFKVNPTFKPETFSIKEK